MFVQPAATTTTAAEAEAEAFYSSLNEKVEILIPNLPTPVYILKKLVPDKAVGSLPYRRY